MINSVFKEGLFEGKVALVTGGGTGIGLRTAKELSYLGAHVVLASRTKEKLDAAVQSIEDAGGKAMAVECNIREEESIADCVAGGQNDRSTCKQCWWPVSLSSRSNKGQGVERSN